MKKISTYLFLVLFSFSNLVHADDVRDFEIEGISIGDSLLDHFSKKIIKKNKKDYYNNDKFTAVEFEDSIFKNYDGAQIHYKTKGDKYIIYALDFVLLFENNFDKCFKNQDQIVNDLSNTFTSLEMQKRENIKHPSDKSGNSNVTSVYLYFDSGDYASVECYNWSEKMGFPDQLRVSITLKELSDWLRTPNIYK
tara:strand:- start:50 stop:631 length:582 start_codon:yes stop_codon:yes gene_type:complete